MQLTCLPIPSLPSNGEEKDRVRELQKDRPHGRSPEWIWTNWYIFWKSLAENIPWKLFQKTSTMSGRNDVSATLKTISIIPSTQLNTGALETDWGEKYPALTTDQLYFLV